MRQIVLDTETTGLDWQKGHKIIEIGCVELVNRRKTKNTFHQYINPDREIDEAAQEVHGLSNEDLADKPFFKDVAKELIQYLGDAELIIHNAEFDLGFLDNELRDSAIPESQLSSRSSVIDTLILARQIHPGQRNNLDALCKRYTIDNSSRDLHGALLDARLLADVYLAMTGGQANLSLDQEDDVADNQTANNFKKINRKGIDLVVTAPTEDDYKQHEQQLDLLDKESSDGAVWRRLNT
ncbi:MAG: DNA polymerase III subunit epsilon [Pseudomonadota bacterium]|nr:DNA polymerase III subunit epsilon [Pseudomonadota bacterium]